MVKEFTSTPIPLLGGEYYFKRCPTGVLTKYDKRIREELDKSEEVRKEGDKLNETQSRIQSRIDNINRKIDLIDRKEDPTDDELDKSMDLLDKVGDLYDELEEVQDKIREYNDENRDYFQDFNDRVNSIIADKLCDLLDKFDKQEFLDNHDSIDMTIATNISKYYEMCMLGERASKIQKTIREDSQRVREQSSFQR